MQKHCICSSQRLPFDTRNPIGYLIAVAIQFVQIECGLFVSANLIAFSIEGFLLALAIFGEVERNLKKMNKYSTKTDENQLKRFGDTVLLHSHLLKLSMDSNNLAAVLFRCESHYLI